MVLQQVLIMCVNLQPSRETRPGHGRSGGASARTGQIYSEDFEASDLAAPTTALAPVYLLPPGSSHGI